LVRVWGERKGSGWIEKEIEGWRWEDGVGIREGVSSGKNRRVIGVGEGGERKWREERMGKRGGGRGRENAGDKKGEVEGQRGTEGRGGEGQKGEVHAGL